MTIVGWESKYQDILKDFGYSRKKDTQSCKLLDSLLPKKTPIVKIRDLIENKPVFVVGAGPSLPSCISILKKYKKITKIVADGATRAIIENSLKADIVVTDLDGDIKSLKKAARLSIGPELNKRIKQIIDTSSLEIKDDFKIYWEKFPIAKLLPGKDYLDPELSVIIDDIIEVAEQKKLQNI